MQYKDKTSVVIKWYKVERFFYEQNLEKIAKLVYHLMQILFGCTIPYSVKIGKNLKIAHFHGIVIHQKSIIGDDCTLYQNVCLGGEKWARRSDIGK